MLSSALLSSALLLAIDTCGPLGAIALARVENGAPVVLGETELPGKTYSAQLIPSVRDLLAAHAASLPDLEAIVVTSGPGSFTGIRIALSAAKGLAEVHSIPLLAVSRLAVLAHKAGASAAAFDASRGEFYFGDDSGGPGENETPMERLLPGDAFRQLASALGPNLAVCEDSAQAAAPSAVRTTPPTAADALRFAFPRFLARSFDNSVTLDGNYLRRSDAEIFSKPDLP